MNVVSHSTSMNTNGERELTTELQGRTEKVGDDLGGESRRRESKGI